MSFLPRKKKHSPSNSAPANTKSHSQSHLQSPQKTQQSQPLYPWSAHTPLFGQSPSPFLRILYALSTGATTTGELFLFGGVTPDRVCNDLYMISTRDFSTTLLKTSGDIPDPRAAHRAVLTSTTLLIWGGRTDFSDQNAQNKNRDDSLYLLNLGTSDIFDVKISSS